jgi:hypothetical protein
MSAVSQAVGLAAAGGLLLAGPAARVTLTAPGHNPVVKTRWHYAVTATRGGKPATGTVTAQIVDPLGSVHLVKLGTTARNVEAIPFKGTFSDFVIWPAESRGIPLTFRLTVKSGKTKKVISYSVTPR